MIRFALLACSSLLASPALAQDPLAPLTPTPRAQESVSDPRVQVATDWNALLTAIDRKQWPEAQTRLRAANPADPMWAVAAAELYLAAESPRVEGNEIAYLVGLAPDLPDAPQLARLAETRGMRGLPVAGQYRMVTLGAASRRQRGRSVDDPVGRTVREAMAPYVDANDAANAESLYRSGLREGLGGEAQSEIAYLVGWIYYLNGQDADARRLASEGRAASRGDWHARSAWVEGLASWRMRDCNAASSAFRDAALSTQDKELAAGGHYWSARAEQMCRRPHEVQARLRAAAADAETFYGQIARETLGMTLRPPERVEAPSERDIAETLRRPNVIRAQRLAAMGRTRQAETYLKHEATVGDPRHHRALIEIAKRLQLGGAQYWLATNGPRGAAVDVADRYPHPGWRPDNGWRIDPYIAFAHIIQESDFRPHVVSPADAVGLMQVRPGTARDEARRRGSVAPSVEDLKRPEVNLDHGQAFIELMRRTPATRDELLRVIASYNAGPLPVERWNSINDMGDPLLWMESLSYWETRHYVPTVLRNYFLYHALVGSKAPALSDLAQHRTPRYPVCGAQGVACAR